MRHITNNAVNEMSAMKSAVLSGGEVPTRVLLAPWGEVESTHGTFVLDAEAASAALAAFAAHGTDVPIDFEHQTLGGAYAAPDGRAPAAGWIKRLHVEPGIGLLADIEWTGEARELLAGKQYRYLSPVAVIRKSDRKLVAIHSAALTNKPAIVGMQPIVNRAETRSDRLETDTDTVRGRSYSAADTIPALDRLRVELGLSAETEGDEVLLAASERLALLRESTKQQHISERVQEAIRAGKLTDAQRGWAETLVARDETLFDEWLHGAPVLVSLGASQAPAATDGKESCQRAAVSRAKAEYRTSRLLSAITTEEAYVASALRDNRSHEAA